MEVAVVNFREESQLENLHDHSQSDKEQWKEQEPQENSKEQNQLPQLSEHEICTRSDESNQPLTSKTGKAVEVVVGKTPEGIQLDKLPKNCQQV